jgi:Uma2 family endonuclease
MPVDKQLTTNESPVDAYLKPFHYYDSHPTKEDLMGESPAQSQLIFYLVQVLRWLYVIERWFVASNLNIYRKRDRYEYPIAPDVALFKGVVVQDIQKRTYRSWRLYEPGRPPPQVVFEISSDTTWKDDLNEKPGKYGELGVSEYFAYDPNDPPYFKPRSNRLRGWRYVDGQPYELSPDHRGWLWSKELARWLGPDGAYLRFYDHDGRRLLTESEARYTAYQVERADKEAALAEAATERAAKEAERAAKEAERTAKEAAWAKLRELGIDPESL